MSTINAQNYGDGANSVPASAVLEGTAKAWSALTTDSGTAGDAYNQSSITDNGTGDNTHNFTNSFASDVFCPTAGSHNSGALNRIAIQDSDDDAAGSARIEVRISDTGASSATGYSITWLGDLA